MAQAATLSEFGLGYKRLGKGTRSTSDLEFSLKHVYLATSLLRVYIIRSYNDLDPAKVTFIAFGLLGVRGT